MTAGGWFVSSIDSGFGPWAGSGTGGRDVDPATVNLRRLGMGKFHPIVSNSVGGRHLLHPRLFGFRMGLRRGKISVGGGKTAAYIVRDYQR